MREFGARGLAKAAFNLALTAVAAAALPTCLSAEASGPDFYKVVDVAPDDVLNVREAPEVSATKVGELAHDADGVRNLGCVGGLTYAQWVEATPEERAASVHDRWCEVALGDVRGWAAARFLGEGSAPDPSPPAEFAWAVAQINGVPAAGEAHVAFHADGRLTGFAGCNAFSGVVAVEGDSLRISEHLAVTMAACADAALASQEAALLSLLSSSPAFRFNPLNDALTLTGADGSAVIVLRRR